MAMLGHGWGKRFGITHKGVLSQRRAQPRAV